MLGGNDDVFLSRLSGKLHPGLCVESRWVEFRRFLGIVRNGNLGVVHNPLTDPITHAGIDALPIPNPAELRVSAPVNEHAKPGVPPPPHPLIALLA